jgi:hypothetical protein
MPKRHEPSHDEIEALAATFRALWRRDKPLRPWLRKHRQMVLDLVHDEWSWNSIAKVFSVAGIKYREGNGKDWHGEGLRCEFARAALLLKRDKNPPIVIDARRARQAKDALDVPRLSDNSKAASFVVASRSAPHEPAAAPAPVAPVPRFKPVSFRPPEPRRMPSPEELAEIEQNRRLTFGHS